MLHYRLRNPIKLLQINLKFGGSLRDTKKRQVIAFHHFLTTFVLCLQFEFCGTDIHSSGFWSKLLVQNTRCALRCCAFSGPPRCAFIWTWVPSEEGALSHRREAAKFRTPKPTPEKWTPPKEATGGGWVPPPGLKQPLVGCRTPPSPPSLEDL